MTSGLPSIKTCLAAAVWTAFGAVAMAADTPGAQAPVAPDRMATARAAIKAKNWSNAIKELSAAVRAEQKNADAHNLLAYSHRKQAQPDLAKAFEHYKIALQLNPQHLGAHEYIGEAYLMDKKPHEAEKHLAILEKLCGNKTCEEYLDLAKAVADYRAK